MKSVLLLGATGTAGSAIAKKLLSDTDCRVTLFARHADQADMSNSRAIVMNGDAAKMEDLLAALKGQEVVFCAISGQQLPLIAENLVKAMSEFNIKRIIFMGAVGIYNEIPDELDGDDNLDNEPAQIPNRQAVDVIEASNLNYTILRPGYLRDGDENDFVLTLKGQAAKGYITTIPSVVKLAIELIQVETLYSRESVSITRGMQ
ncbi:NAD(P)H-binding protein [Lacrimispora brassicae]